MNCNFPVIMLWLSSVLAVLSFLPDSPAWRIAMVAVALSLTLIAAIGLIRPTRS